MPDQPYLSKARSRIDMLAWPNRAIRLFFVGALLLSVAGLLGLSTRNFLIRFVSDLRMM